MYRLQVFHTGSVVPTETLTIRQAAEVLQAIPELLARHPGCAHVEVLMDSVRLFAVDCTGARLPN